MWPVGHLAFGYLVYAGGLAAWGRSPEAWPVVALAVGTQFPDIVDKPLVLWFGVLPAGRTLMHSLVTFVPLSVAALALTWHVGRAAEGTAFTVGWGSHLIGDSIHFLVRGAYDQVTFLVWPFLPLPRYYTDDTHVQLDRFVERVANLDLAALANPGGEIVALQAWLGVVVFLLWVVQGMPPVLAAWRWVRREYETVRRR